MREEASPRKLQVASCSCKLFSLLKKLCVACLAGGKLCLPPVALFDMPNLNRFNILSISIFCKIALSISISIFSKITISISISIFLELPYRYRYRYRYFSELPYRYRYRYRYFQLLHIDIDIFQKCRYIDNRYFISIF